MKDLFCTFEDCEAVADVRGRELCRRHYSRLAKSKSLPDLPECIEDGCLRTSNFRGFCKAHRWIHYPEYFRRLGNASKGVNVDESGSRKRCTEDRCGQPAHCKGLCKKHYTASKRPVYLSPNKKYDGSVAPCKGSDGCDRDAISNGYCYKHWERVNRNGSDVLENPMSPCPVPGCENMKKHGVARLCSRCSAFRHRYSLTVERLIEISHPDVKMCGNLGCRSTERLHLDHDHACCGRESRPSGRVSSCGQCVRGWLCHHCNTSLGSLQENPRKIRGLLDYLEVHRNL